LFRSRSDLQSDYLGMWGSSANRIWLVGTAPVIRRYDGTGYADEDVAWPPEVGEQRFAAVHGYGADGGNVWAVGDLGLVYRRTASSTPQWTERSSGLHGRLFALAFDGDQPYAVGAAGAVLTRIDNAWEVSDPRTYAELDDVWAGGGEVVAVGGAIARRRGGSWRVEEPLPPAVAALEGIAGAPGEQWAVGRLYSGGAAVLRSIDGGAFTLAPPAPPGVSELWDVFWAGPGDVWVSGSNGHVSHRQQDGGWVDETQGWATLYGLWGTDGGELWAVGSSAAVHHRNAGGSWGQVTIPGADPTHAFWDVGGSAANDVWVCGEDGIFHFDGGEWSRPKLPVELINGDGIESVRAHGSMVFAVGTKGTILAAPR
ncbi:MAG: WD40/YVTN/BNR-like repeat-containing protein, partial [Myxococcaceae bacterium]